MISQDGEEYTIDFSRKIGSGAYGNSLTPICNVHPGRASSGRTVAVKCARDAKEIVAARKEVEFYRRCAGARNIVKYVGSQHKNATDHSPERFSFAMERALFSLDKLMKQVRHLRGLPKDIIVDLLVDSTSALNALKTRGIAHRDIKHLNILVFPGQRRGRKSQYLFKFCDMGVSSFVHEGGVMQTLVGTPHALCPAMADAHANRQAKTRANYTREECDLWSLGCTFYYVATGKSPFPIDTKDSNVYAHAVAEANRPEGAISAERVSFDANRYMYKYGYTIPNDSYPKWFRHCLAKLIATLFSKEPTLESLDEMVSALEKSVEKKFISIESMEIFSYCDLKDVPQFSRGYPTLKDELSLKDGVKYQLIYEDDLVVFADATESGKPHQNSPILFPLLTDIPWTPKIWWRTIQDKKGPSKNGEESSRTARIDMHSQVGDALNDCDKILDVVEMSKKILRVQLERIKSNLESVHEKTLMPIRFTLYAKMQSFALLPFLSEEADKTVMDRVCEMAGRATKELEKCVAFLNQSLDSATECLSELDKIQLEPTEIPGVEDELNDLLNDDPSTGVFHYEEQLAEQCIARRSDLAAQLCNNTKSSVVRVLLRTARFVLDMSSEISKYRNYIDDYVSLIERPFQEMKNCMERMQAEHKLDERSFQKALLYYKRPANIIAQTRLIREKVSQVFDLVQQVNNSK
ncbi:hypothetical protein Y032_0009g663 [Ancylostoma ceylanicum]|uniref:IkappaB kinase n=1 Tax=Ancylostoma ceylanicum TaxID=53326 RepID=A0A016VI95_9BILA|nr:hypothetical protein Y032_0009g663 [Ancylostoma ceylanicum]